MYVKQFFVEGLAHSSYILGGNQTCAVIDPKRDVNDYIRIAKAMGLKITHIMETHLHADFILAQITLLSYLNGHTGISIDLVGPGVSNAFHGLSVCINDDDFGLHSFSPPTVATVLDTISSPLSSWAVRS